MSRDKRMRDRNKKILQFDTQKVEKLLCPHCQSQNNEKVIRKPKEWRNGVWDVTCKDCHKDFNLHIILQIHSMQTAEQLEILKKEAEENERKALEENSAPALDQQFTQVNPTV